MTENYEPHWLEIVIISLFTIIIFGCMFCAIFETQKVENDIRQNCKLIKQTRGFFAEECYICPKGDEQCL